MSEVMKDSAIKLFGKTITLLPDKAAVSDVSLSENRESSFATSTSHDSKDEHESMDPTEETVTEVATSSDIDDESNTPEKEEESNDSNTPDEEKTLKKPDKILPCPRCKSMDTKFCYYNNYNVNQPRYFCKNCQRYWTSGGTMRNVPVGSGRRKTKHAALPNPHHIMVSDGTLSSGGFLFGPDPGFPVSFYPTATYWTVPVSVSSSLGKHSREEENMVVTSKENLDAERSVWIPKTLRIHDPSEAAKSSLWSTLGRIKNEKPGPFNATGLFKAFDPKGDRINHVDSREMVRQANPAALSRSLNFHESA